jgi:hypothetical protein
VTARLCRLDAAKPQAAKVELAKIETEGVIRRSDSAWSSPYHMVRKADGSWRSCCDYHRLDLSTQPDKYLLPNSQDLSSRLQCCTVFSKLNLRRRCYQMPVAARYICSFAKLPKLQKKRCCRMSRYFGLHYIFARN